MQDRPAISASLFHVVAIPICLTVINYIANDIAQI
jgi:hypothetical protein